MRLFHGVGLAVGPPAVAGARLQSADLDVPDVAGAVEGPVERQLEHRVVAAGGEQHQGHRRRVAGEDREVQAAAGLADAEGHGMAGRDVELAAERVARDLMAGAVPLAARRLFRIRIAGLVHGSAPPTRSRLPRR